MQGKRTMADSIDNKHDTSEEYFDPYCDLCYETKGINVKVFCYCEDCFQFLCADCHVFHAKLQGTKTHNVLKDEMPKSQADKLPRYERCDHQNRLRIDFVYSTRFCYVQHVHLLNTAAVLPEAWRMSAKSYQILK